MIGKRGQLTLFVIVAVVVIVGIVGYFLISNSVWEKKTNYDIEGNSLKDALSDCFNGIAVDSIQEVGIQGGYFNEPLSEYFYSGTYRIPFYYFEQLRYTPTLNVIETELAYAFDSRTQECFEILENNQGIVYDYEYYFPNVSIRENQVFFMMNFDVVINKENVSKKISFVEEPVIIDSNLYEMQRVASYIAYLYYLDNEFLCVSCYLELVSETGLYVDVVNEDDGMLLVNVYDDKVGNYPRYYSFLMSNFEKTGGQEIGVEKSYFFVLDDAEEINAYAPKS